MRALNVLALGLMFSVSSLAAKIDTSASKFKWTGHKGALGKIVGTHFGNISLKTADVKVDANNNPTSGTFVMNMKSMTVTDIKDAGTAGKLLGHLKSDDFFKVEKFPTATLKVTSFKGGMATGTLTILGKTNPVSFKYKKSGNTYSGKIDLDRTKWGIKYGSGKFFKGLADKTIHDTFTIDFTAVIKG